MDNNKRYEEEAKTELERQEVEEYQNSETRDSFDVWKMKKYIDFRFYFLLGLIIVLVSFLYGSR